MVLEEVAISPKSLKTILKPSTSPSFTSIMASFNVSILFKTPPNIDVIAEKLVQVINTETWNKQASSIFTNLSDCRRIKGLMMVALAAAQTASEGV